LSCTLPARTRSSPCVVVFRFLVLGGLGTRRAFPPCNHPSHLFLSLFRLFPSFQKQYTSFRSGFSGDTADTRAIFWGLDHILETFVERPWTHADVDAAAAFWATHRVGPAGEAAPYPFPRDLFTRFIEENAGYFPVTIQALPPGSVVRPHVPLMQISAVGPYAPLATWLETLITHVWYPSSVATLARRVRDAVEAAFETSVDDGAASPLLPSRLHDFGFRGVTGLDQAVAGGIAHLLSWTGTDTAPAAWVAQHTLNGGLPVAASIPATEHAVMTAWPSEREAVGAVLARHAGGGPVACVLDSYDYRAALETIVPDVAATVTEAGGFLVIRPDSGDPLDAVLAGLRAAEAAFGCDVNGKGFKVPRHSGVIQGDGMDAAAISRVLKGVLEAGFAASAVAFGMGGGLLQKVDRDTLAVATKLSHISTTTDDGNGGPIRTRTDVMKAPRTDAGKASLPGRLAAERVPAAPGVAVNPADPATFYLRAAGAGEALGPGGDALGVVYDCGPVPGRVRATDNSPGAFEALRARVAAGWAATPRGAAGAVSPALERRAAAVRAAGGRAPAE
jgi:nicotinamide phosphoribosyltransferase